MSKLKRKNPFVWLAVALLAVIWMGAAPAPSQQALQQKLFGAIFLQKGLPPNLPAPVAQHLGNDLKNIEYASIPTGSASNKVSFFRGEPISTGRRFATEWIWYRDSSGMGVLSAMSFKREADGSLSSKPRLYQDESDHAATPLELRLLPDHHLLLYRWTGTAAGLAGGVPSVKEFHQETMMGKPIPDFTAQRLDGSLVSLGEFRGHILVLNTWATSCVGCVEEMPGLNKLVKKFGKRGIIFLALADNTKEQVINFLGFHPYKYRQALLGKRGMKLFGNAFPRNLIVDPHGTIVYDLTAGSPKTASRLEPVIEKLLAKGK